MTVAMGNVLCTRAFVDELVRSGVRHVSVCPGSRSTPLAVAFARHGAIRVWVHLDERSAAYFALGLAKSSYFPVALLCTSGTAAANFLPAIIEASLSGVPLLVLTADRPAELHQIGANQTIDQLDLYGDYVAWSVRMPLPEARDDVLAYFRVMACRAVSRSLETPGAPVHLNFPFREPFLPADGEAAPTSAVGKSSLARPAGSPWVQMGSGSDQDRRLDLAWLMETMSSATRGLIVVGPQPDMAAGRSIRKLAALTRFPILADPLSQVRHGPDHGACVVDRYDAFLRDDATAGVLAPDVIYRLGATPTSKPLLEYMRRHAASRQVLVQRGSWNDPLLVATDAVDATPGDLAEALLSAPGDVVDGDQAVVARRAWAARWRRLNEVAGDAVDAATAAFDDPFEGRALAELGALLPDDATLFLGNSMPIRDADTFLPARLAPLRVVGNRGASGIDGVVSSALGVSVNAAPTVLVVGDLSFYHDLNGLMAAKLHGLSLTVVLIHNDGGGIFSFLPQASATDVFEPLFGTPHGLDFRPVVEMYGGRFTPATNWNRFREAVGLGITQGGLHVVEVRTDRKRNVEQHAEVWRCVRAAIHAMDPSALNLSPSAGAGRP